MLVISVNVLALDIDRENFNIAYLSLPSEPIVYERNRNYSYDFDSKHDLNDIQLIVQENLHIQGFQPLQDNATVHINFQFDDILITNTNVESKSRKIKNQEGDTQLEHYYIPEINYSTSATVVVYYTNGKTKTFDFGSKRNSHNGEELYSTYDAENYLATQETIYTLFREFVISTVKNVNTKLNKLHGYKVIKDTDYLLILDSRTYPEYKDYKRHFSLSQKLFNQMTPFDSIEGIENELRYFISFLEHIPGNYQGGKKSHIKMRYASYYNLAKIYYYLDDLDKSIYYYEKVIENDYHEGQSKRNIKAINKLKGLFAINQVNSRHFPIELDLVNNSVILDVNTEQQFTPSINQHVEKPQENQLQSPSENYIYLDAEIITIDQVSTEGKIELNLNDSDALNQLQNSTTINLKFLNSSNEIELKSFYSSAIESIQLEESRLQRIIFYSQKELNANKVNTGKVTNGILVTGLAEELYSSDKVSLYRYNDDIIFQKPKEQSGTSTSSTAFSFAFKRKLGQYFSDCFAIQRQIKSGIFKNTSQSLIQAAIEYSNCSE